MKPIGIFTIIILLAALGGCGSTAAEKRTTAELAKLPYPKSAAIGDDLEVIVEQSRTTVKLTNITPHSFHNVQVWLNQQYVTPVKSIPLGVGGKSTELDLERFIDSHGRSYPVGGILSPDKGFPVVLAEIFDPATGRRHRLVVRR
jgi:hypothetical protein